MDSGAVQGTYVEPPSFLLPLPPTSSILEGMQIQAITPGLFKSYRAQIFSIFLKNSNYQQKSLSEQEAYFEKWVGTYFLHWPDWFFVALDQKNEEVLAYLCACPDSLSALDLVSFQSYHAFSKQYQKFPLHFHINVKPGITGRGLGSLLIESLKQKALSEGINSLHIITGASEKNVGFYQKNHFKIQETALVNGHDLYLMTLDF